jgi:hypothetical protein
MPKHPEPATPFQKLSNEHLQALEKLADIFAGAAPRVEAGRNPNKSLLQHNKHPKSQLPPVTQQPEPPTRPDR